MDNFLKHAQVWLVALVYHAPVGGDGGSRDSVGCDCSGAGVGYDFLEEKK